jgi:hypothetical protein
MPRDTAADLAGRRDRRCPQGLRRHLHRVLPQHPAPALGARDAQPHRIRGSTQHDPGGRLTPESRLRFIGGRSGSPWNLAWLMERDGYGQVPIGRQGAGRSQVQPEAERALQVRRQHSVHDQHEIAAALASWRASRIKARLVGAACWCTTIARTKRPPA